MSAALDPIWQAYIRAVGALDVVRHVASSPGLGSHKDALLSGTDFDGIPAADVEHRFNAAMEQVKDQTVLSLYAAFESALRDHLIKQAVHLKTHATKPDTDFAAALAEVFEGWCEDGRMDRVEGLFRGAVGPGLVAQAGQIRHYRHWYAHGKRWAKPPQTTPTFAYKTLDAFLSKACCG